MTKKHLTIFLSILLAFIFMFSITSFNAYAINKNKIPHSKGEIWCQYCKKWRRPKNYHGAGNSSGQHYAGFSGCNHFRYVVNLKSKGYRVNSRHKKARIWYCSRCHKYYSDDVLEPIRRYGIRWSR